MKFNVEKNNRMTAYVWAISGYVNLRLPFEWPGESQQTETCDHASMRVLPGEVYARLKILFTLDGCARNKQDRMTT